MQEWGKRRVKLEAHVSHYQIKSHHLTKEELEGALREQLEKYLREKVEAVKTTDVDIDKQTTAVNVLSSNPISDPAFASAAAAWISLRSQEKQTRLNIRLQLLIVSLAMVQILVVLLPLLLHR